MSAFPTHVALLAIWGLASLGAIVVLIAWLRQARADIRYLAALRAGDWPQVERYATGGE